jgi:hypothetical protein
MTRPGLAQLSQLTLSNGDFCGARRWIRESHQWNAIANRL